MGAELAAAGYPVHSLGLDLKHAPAWRLAAAVRRLLKEIRPDILHTHLYHPNLYGRLAALGLGLPGVVAAVHNSYTRVKFHRRLWNHLLGWASDRILVGSAQVWEDVRRYDAVPASRLLLLPYGIDPAELETGLSPAEARSLLSVSGFVLAAVGRLEEQKGQQHLLAAMAGVRRQIPEATLILVGDGRQRQALERQAQELGLADQGLLPGNPPGPGPHLPGPGPLRAAFPLGGAAPGPPQGHGGWFAGSGHPSQAASWSSSRMGSMAGWWPLQSRRPWAGSWWSATGARNSGPVWEPRLAAPSGSAIPRRRCWPDWSGSIWNFGRKATGVYPTIILTKDLRYPLPRLEGVGEGGQQMVDER